MKLYSDSKVYIFCPGNYSSGGPELLHQLASQLLSFGVQAYMVYYQLMGFYYNPNDPVHDLYREYHVPYVSAPEDNSKNIIIASESATNVLYYTEKSQRVIWWLSVDNYMYNISLVIKYHKFNALAEPMPKVFYFNETDADIDHFVQSEYARQFIKLNGVPEERIYVVEDYLNQVFLNRAAQIDLSRKENFVAYNPKKGFEFTQQLMNLAPDIDWLPIEKMTPAQVQELLARAKIYIDFGEHPGKDRLPREATISKCVVITGRRGAAGNDVDYNIPDEFKFDEQTADLHDIIKKIREVFENFLPAYDSQKNFRAKELNAQKNFVAEVIDAFGIKKFPPQSVALTQGVGEKSYLIAKEILKSKDFTTKFIIDDANAAITDTDNEKFIWRNRNRNFLRFDKDPIEIISRDDAKFLYAEGRIKKFALFEPTDAELDDFKNFYEPNYSDVLIFNR